MTYCKKRKIKTSFNPSSYQTKLGMKVIGPMVKNCHVLSLNREEAKMLVKKDSCRGLHKLGPEIVIVSCGDKMGEVYDGKFLYRYFPNKVKVYEKTGAGDVFSSSFIAGLIKTKDVEMAIKIAMANAESHVSTKGAKEGLLNWNQVSRITKKKKFKVVKVIM